MEDLYKKATINFKYSVFSRNQIDKLHWAKKANLKKTYTLFIKSNMNAHKIPSAQKEDFFKLNIVVYRRRLLDYDNLVGGCKQLIDALVTERFIWDDAPKYIDMNIKQVKKADQEISITRELIRA